jgi:flagella basal body P-ring formation protein FlgA
MKRRFLLLALLGALATDAGAAGPAVTLPVMRAEATVSGEIVRLGDLIENAGPAAAVPAFHAPDLGASGTIQAYRVMELARDNGISHIDTRGLQEVTIFRAVRTVSTAELETAVTEAAARNLGIADTRDVTVRFDRDVRALQVEPGAADAPRINQFSYDSHSRRFDGVVEIPGSLISRRNPVRISGTLIETAEIVVVARPLARGETIRESDILLERRPRAELSSDSVIKSASVVGQAARRALRPGQTLRPADLMKPDLVGRNDMVTIVFEAHGITLTARGKALEAGAEGDTISVLNPQSKRVLHATVQGPGRVVVNRGASLAADTTGSVR